MRSWSERDVERADLADAGFHYELGFGPGRGSVETSVYFSPVYLPLVMRALDGRP